MRSETPTFLHMRSKDAEDNLGDKGMAEINGGGEPLASKLSQHI